MRNHCSWEQAEFKFTGQRKDAGTGLDYYNVRYYDPETGRFTREDEYQGDVFWPQTQNQYAEFAAMYNKKVNLDDTIYVDMEGNIKLTSEATMN